MAITDLLPSGSFSLRRRRAAEPEAASDGPSGDGAPGPGTFDDLFHGVPLPAAGASPWAPAPGAPTPEPSRTLPGTGLTERQLVARAAGALALLAALAVAVLTADEAGAWAPADAWAADAPAADAPAAASAPPPAATEVVTEQAAASDVPAAFPAEPVPVPADFLTQLEGASDAPLRTELSLLLDAIAHGFGTQSAQLEPTLRSYAYRMSSRFEWNPDTYRLAVTAPDPALAEARAAMLSRLFQTAVASGRLQIGAAAGPHALALVSE